MDYIGYYEEMNGSWKIICDKLGIEYSNIKDKNKKRYIFKKPIYRNMKKYIKTKIVKSKIQQKLKTLGFYDKDIINKIQNFYSNDMELFNYDSLE